MDNQAESVMMCERAPWRVRLIRKFVGVTPVNHDLPEWAKDGIMVRTHVKFSLRDRIIVALTGNIIIRSWTACENPPGRVETTSDVSPELY